MVDNGYIQDEHKIETWWAGKTVADLKLSTPLTIAPTVTCQEAIEVMKENVSA